MGSCDRPGARPALRAVARGALVLLFLLLAPAGAPAAESTGTKAAPAEDAAATRQRMGAIFESMRVLLPLSVSDAAFADPANRKVITSALETVMANADAVARHAGDEAGRRFLGRSLETDARHALERYREGRYDSAAFLVQQATENCIACHTKRASAGDAAISAEFVDQTALAELPPEERARLQIATRQFDAALDTLETVITSPGLHPATLIGPITDYLTVSIRVKGDLQRPIPVLEKLAAREDLWVQLRGDVEQWIADLRSLGDTLRGPADLASARALMEEARDLAPFGSSQRGLVRFLVASSLLHRLLEREPASKPEAAEAWYLLGVCELRVGDTFWLSQADWYLETAIRTAPDSSAAEAAYALLEAETIEGYTGSGGTHLPPSVAAHLAELRKLMEPR